MVENSTRRYNNKICFELLNFDIEIIVEIGKKKLLETMNIIWNSINNFLIFDILEVQIITTI